MSKTVVGLFSNYGQAEEVARQLEDQGYSRSDISVVANDHEGKYTSTATGEGSHAASGAGTGAAIGGAAGLALGLVALAIPGIGPIIALGPLATALTGAGIGAAAGGLIGAMTSLGVPEEDASHYAGRVKEGEALVMVTTPDNRAQTAADLLENYGAENVDKRDGANDRTAPVATGTTTQAAPRTAQTTTATNTASSIPVVEEELVVGKRQVSRGGVRVYTHMTEQPVTEQVQLREEHVNVQRRPVNREASTSDFSTFKEGTIEVEEMAEEAVVGKRARVVEEISLGKESTQRTETVRDTVRHTEVEVEEVSPAAFQEHYQQNYASTGQSFDTYAPGYQYGSELANDPQYKGRSWNDVESNARSSWNKRGSGSGTWDSLKDSIRHGYDKARNAVTSK